MTVGFCVSDCVSVCMCACVCMCVYVWGLSLFLSQWEVSQWVSEWVCLSVSLTVCLPISLSVSVCMYSCFSVSTCAVCVCVCGSVSEWDSLSISVWTLNDPGQAFNSAWSAQYRIYLPNKIAEISKQTLREKWTVKFHFYRPTACHLRKITKCITMLSVFSLCEKNTAFLEFR